MFKQAIIFVQCFYESMKVSANYKFEFKPNFKSVKLNDLMLRRKLPNGGEELVAAELHKLDALDLPMIEKLYSSYPDGQAPKFLKDIREYFTATFSSKNKNLSHKKLFLMVKQNGVVQTICAATVKAKSICLKYISNLDRANGIKGAGTSIIVKLAEFAKKMNKPEINLVADVAAIPFYQRLNFIVEDMNLNFRLFGKPLDDLLTTFKSKYFCKK